MHKYITEKHNIYEWCNIYNRKIFVKTISISEDIFSEDIFTGENPGVYLDSITADAEIMFDDKIVAQEKIIIGVLLSSKDDFWEEFHNELKIKNKINCINLTIKKLNIKIKSKVKSK